MPTARNLPRALDRQRILPVATQASFEESRHADRLFRRQREPRQNLWRCRMHRQRRAQSPLQLPRVPPADQPHRQHDARTPRAAPRRRLAVHSSQRQSVAAEFLHRVQGRSHRLLYQCDRHPPRPGAPVRPGEAQGRVRRGGPAADALRAPEGTRRDHRLHGPAAGRLPRRTALLVADGRRDRRQPRRHQRRPGGLPDPALLRRHDGRPQGDHVQHRQHAGGQGPALRVAGFDSGARRPPAAFRNAEPRQRHRRSSPSCSAAGARSP